MKRLTLSLLVAILAINAGVVQSQTVGTLINTSSSVDGYTLFAPLSSTTTYLINNCGEVVNDWEGSTGPRMSAYLLEDGSLLRGKTLGNQTFTAGGSGGGVQLYDWDGTLVWDYTISSASECHHHDVELLPNGNVLFIVWGSRTEAEAIQAGRVPINAPETLWPEKIIEVEPSGTNGGNVVWEWYVWDHLVQDKDVSKDNYGVVADHPELVDINFTDNDNRDWLHTNAIDYNAELDQIVMSVRSMHEIWIIDHSTTTTEAASHSGGNSGKGGDLLYRWGNPQTYGRESPTNGQKLFGQHDIRWVEVGTDAGKLMVFNNGDNRLPSVSYSTVDIIETPVDAFGNYTEPATGESFGPIDLFWTYESDSSEDFYSSKLSGAHRLPNDNTVICEGGTGRFFEVTTDGDVVWEYLSPVTSTGVVNQGTTPVNGNAVFRCTRYSPDYGAFTGRDLTPGNVIELNSTVNCDLFSEVTDLADTPTEQGIEVIVNQNARYIMVTEIPQSGIISIYDSFGRLILEKKTSSRWETLNTSYWPSGIYYLSLTQGQTKLTKKFLIL
jgi:hypothetical protein